MDYAYTFDGDRCLLSEDPRPGAVPIAGPPTLDDRRVNVETLEELGTDLLTSGELEVARMARKHARERKWSSRDSRAFVLACLWLRRVSPYDPVEERFTEPKVPPGVVRTPETTAKTWGQP